jgi:hypothetical protein
MRFTAKSITQGTLIMNPPGVKPVREFPREADCLYKISGLFDGMLPGDMLKTKHP